MTAASGGDDHAPARGKSQPQPAAGYAPQVTPDSERRLDGNGVVLEDEMIKLTQARMDYDAAIGFYQQSLSMIQLAIHTPLLPSVTPVDGELVYEEGINLGYRQWLAMQESPAYAFGHGLGYSSWKSRPSASAAPPMRLSS